MKQSAIAAFEEMNASVKISVSSIVSESDCKWARANVVCPKPRRMGLINTCGIDPIRPLGWHICCQQEADAKAGAELLDTIVPKGSCGIDQSCAQVASSPPFFCGSPPSRVSNPVIQDTRFGDAWATPESPRAFFIPPGLSVSPKSSARTGGACVRANFGNNPAVRIEGFAALA